MKIRPLRRSEPGVWRSREGSWLFLRHHSDPHPQRWFAFFDEDHLKGGDALDTAGHLSLADAVEAAEQFVADRGES